MIASILHPLQENAMADSFGYMGYMGLFFVVVLKFFFGEGPFVVKCEGGRVFARQILCANVLSSFHPLICTSFYRV